MRLKCCICNYPINGEESYLTLNGDDSTHAHDYCYQLMEADDDYNSMPKRKSQRVRDMSEHELPISYL